MSCLWMCLSLLYAAFFLPSESASKRDHSPVVSLHCKKTVEVKDKDSVTLNCTLSIAETQKKNCIGKYYCWKNTSGTNLCDISSMKYKCEWNSLSYVSLTISNPKTENYTIKVQATCGENETSIEVRVKPSSNGSTGGTNSLKQFPEVRPAVLTAALGSFIVVGILLCFLLRIKKKNKDPQEEKEEQENMISMEKSNCSA